MSSRLGVSFMALGVVALAAPQPDRPTPSQTGGQWPPSREDPTSSLVGSVRLVEHPLRGPRVIRFGDATLEGFREEIEILARLPGPKPDHSAGR